MTALIFGFDRLDAVQVRLESNHADLLEHGLLRVDREMKLQTLSRLLRRHSGSAIIFGRTKHGVKKLAKQLVTLGYPAAALQGNLSQNARDAVMADFRSRRVPILLATNVAARGLDVEHIGLVINYELPETTDLLTHRVGRTGRMGREGDAVTLLAPSDEDKWRRLSRDLKVRIPRKRWTAETPPTPAAVNAIPLYERSPQRSPLPPQRERARVRVPEATHSPAPQRRQTLPESERRTGRTWQQDREGLVHEEAMPAPAPRFPHLSSPGPTRTANVGEGQKPPLGEAQRRRRRRKSRVAA